MGYTTDFDGSFQLNKPLTEKMKDFLMKFADSRRMKRNQPAEFGVEGEFYVDGGSGGSGMSSEKDVIDSNQPPSTQPGLWCKWIPNDDGTEIIWDGGEKFYDYTEWLVYLIHKILKPNGYVLNGEVTWQGEETGDVGEITVKNNVVFSKPWKGKKEKITPENAAKSTYVSGKGFIDETNYMRPDVVFIIDEKSKTKKVTPVNNPKSVSIEIDGLESNLDEKQLKTLMNVVVQYTKQMVGKDGKYVIKHGESELKIG